MEADNVVQRVLACLGKGEMTGLSPLRDGPAGRTALRFTAPPAESVGWTQISEGGALRRPNS
jgi:hypothetical protein